MKYEGWILWVGVLMACKADPPQDSKALDTRPKPSLEQPKSSPVVVQAPLEAELKGAHDSIMVELLADLDKDGQDEKIQAVQVDHIPLESFHNHLRIFKQEGQNWRLFQSDTGILNTMESWGSESSYDAGNLSVSKGILNLEFGSRFQSSIFHYRYQKGALYLIGATTWIRGDESTSALDVNFSTHLALRQFYAPHQGTEKPNKSYSIQSQKIQALPMDIQNTRIQIWDPIAQDSLTLTDIGEG